MGLSRDRGLNGMTIVIYNEMTILTMFPLRPKNYYLFKKKKYIVRQQNKIFDNIEKINLGMIEKCSD